MISNDPPHKLYGLIAVSSPSHNPSGNSGAFSLVPNEADFFFIPPDPGLG
jgi:hypothetical protein